MPQTAVFPQKLQQRSGMWLMLCAQFQNQGVWAQGKHGEMAMCMQPKTLPSLASSRVGVQAPWIKILVSWEILILLGTLAKWIQKPVASKTQRKPVFHVIHLFLCNIIYYYLNRMVNKTIAKEEKCNWELLTWQFDHWEQSYTPVINIRLELLPSSSDSWASRMPGPPPSLRVRLIGLATKWKSFRGCDKPSNKLGDMIWWAYTKLSGQWITSQRYGGGCFILVKWMNEWKRTSEALHFTWGS